ncbi:hypothetical protein [Corynebacterium liangguodongii]|uniref:Uncharacterized protein n=1 Tax=Corynebacterium liangguodongii TaxID=2079535 RepID=A0A2S0WG30_9CORY|nr:hypothetical protein [Corynebacterium liangguodongii]AWB84731.1 hypothetical protein C3E79_09805 [Corynebacterium liangguodongii]PWB99739.1 hypothetical protein DF219_05585 [Corynebacterium liangguodongii]
MKRTRLAALATSLAVVATGVAAPHARAWENGYNAATDTCTITFTESDQEKVNDAYRQLFELIARNAFAGLSEREGAGLIEAYALDPATKNAALLSPDAETRGAQTRFFMSTGDDHSNYVRGVAFANLSKREVIEDGDREIVMFPAQAHEEGGPLYGVDLAGVAMAAAWTSAIDGGISGAKDLIVETAKENYPRFAAPILTYSKAFEACANKKDSTGAVSSGSSLSGDQLSSIGIAGGVVALILIAALGFAARPLVDQWVAGMNR